MLLSTSGYPEVPPGPSVEVFSGDKEWDRVCRRESGGVRVGKRKGGILEKGVGAVKGG